MSKLLKRILVPILIFALLPLQAFADNTYLSILHTDDIIPYTYENITSDEINSIISRTENLKINYTKEESMNLLKEIQVLVKEKITNVDYYNHKELKYDESNYEKNGFYKYKYGNLYWSVRNIVSLLTTYESYDETLMKEMIDIIYDMSNNEIKNGSLEHDMLNILNEFLYIKDRFPETLLPYIDYIIDIAETDLMDVQSGTVPTERVPSESYDEYIKEQEENKPITDRPSSGEFTEPVVTPVPDSIEGVDKIEVNPVITNPTTTFEPSTFTESTINDYLNVQNSTSNKSKVSVTKYDIKSVYYTLNKQDENVIWNDTGITINSEKESIKFNKIVSIFTSMAKNDAITVINDNDMIMLIIDGRPLIVNNVEEVKTDVLLSLFDNTENIDIEIKSKSDESSVTEVSLEDKIKEGKLNTISIDGSNLILNNSPIVTKNMLQLPIEQVAKSLGYEVTVTDKTVTLTKDDLVVELTINSHNYKVNGDKYSFKSNVTKSNDVIYCEITEIAKLVGYTYSYNVDTDTLEFNKTITEEITEEPVAEEVTE